MGVDVRIVLPCDVRIQDVAIAIAIFAGLDKTWNAHKESGWVVVDKSSLSIKSSDIVGLANIVLDKKPLTLVDGETTHSVLFHFEGGDNPLGVLGGKVLLPPKTPFWQAIGVKLVSFFGGALDLDDSDSVDINLSYPRPRRTNSPEDGHEWDKFQQELYALEPLSATDLETNWKAIFLDRDIQEALDKISEENS